MDCALHCPASQSGAFIVCTLLPQLRCCSLDSSCFTPCFDLINSGEQFNDPSQPPSMNQSSLVHQSSQSHNHRKKYNSHALVLLYSFSLPLCLFMSRSLARSPASRLGSPVSLARRISLSHTHTHTHTHSCSFSPLLFFLSSFLSLSSHLHSLSQPCPPPSSLSFSLSLSMCVCVCVCVCVSDWCSFCLTLTYLISLVSQFFTLVSSLLSHDTHTHMHSLSLSLSLSPSCSGRRPTCRRCVIFTPRTGSP